MSKTHDVEVIMVGDELLKGERSDRHLAFIGQQLLARGLRVSRAHVCGDDIDAIATQVSECAARTRVLILSGGLGPTDDDITREGVARGLDLSLEFHEPTWDLIVAFFAKRGREPSDANRRQAHFPAGATILDNQMGTAPGFAITIDDLDVFVLPGPPVELRPMVERDVVARVREIFGREALCIETFRTIGVGESQLVTLLKDAVKPTDDYAVSMLPSLTGVDIVYTQKVGASAEAVTASGDRFASVLEEAIGTKFYERGKRSLAEVVHDALVARGETLAIAESLTGGWIGKLLTDIPGSSAYLRADAVTYCDESKQSIARVREETLKEFGAVSEYVCTEMAHGMRNATGATYGLSTTGIAGPGGATDKKPVGLTFIGVAFEEGSHIKRVTYRGGRDIIRQQATQGALWLLHDHLEAHR